LTETEGEREKISLDGFRVGDKGSGKTIPESERKILRARKKQKGFKIQLKKKVENRDAR